MRTATVLDLAAFTSHSRRFMIPFTAANGGLHIWLSEWLEVSGSKSLGYSNINGYQFEIPNTRVLGSSQRNNRPSIRHV